MQNKKPDLDHFSYSSLSLYDTCPLRFYVQYFMKLGRTDNIYSLKGKIVHSFNEFLATMITKGLHLQTHWSQILDHIIWKYEIRFPEITKYLDKKVIYNICKVVHDSDLMYVNIQGIEKYFVLAIEKKSGHPLMVDRKDVTPELEKHYYIVVGFMDMVYKDDLAITVRDWKTGKPHTREELRIDPQHKIYTIVESLMFPTYKNFVMEYIYLSEDKFKKVSFTDSSDDALLFSMDIADKCRKIEESKSFPCKPNGLCDKFCPLNGICKIIEKNLTNGENPRKIELNTKRQMFGYDSSGL